MKTKNNICIAPGCNNIPGKKFKTSKYCGKHQGLVKDNSDVVPNKKDFTVQDAVVNTVELADIIENMSQFDKYEKTENSIGDFTEKAVTQNGEFLLHINKEAGGRGVLISKTSADQKRTESVAYSDKVRSETRRNGDDEEKIILEKATGTTEWIKKSPEKEYKIKRDASGKLKGFEFNSQNSEGFKTSFSTEGRKEIASREMPDGTELVIEREQGDVAWKATSPFERVFLKSSFLNGGKKGDAALVAETIDQSLQMRQEAELMLQQSSLAQNI